MIVCASCHARNANRSTFCIRCGGSLVTAGERDPSAHTDTFVIQPEQTPAGLVDLAATQLAEGRAQAAVENCRRAIALSPGEVQAHAILGMAYEQQGELAAALEAYEAVVALAPERQAERQKAALLRLRLGQHTETPGPRHAHGTRPAGPVFPFMDRVKALVATNPPLYAGLASGLVIFLLGTIFIISANRAQATRARDGQYTQEVRLGDEALANQQYAEASIHYAAAWQIRQDDPQLQARWGQAYQLAQSQPQLGQVGPVAQLPKYIPNTNPNRNPFEPVPIGANGVPPDAAALAAGAAQAVPPPTVVPERPPLPYETVHEQARSVPPPTTPVPGGHSTRPSPFGPSQPISAVPGTNVKPVPTPAPAADTTLHKSGGEVTIWMSDKQPAPRPQAEPANPSANPEALRSRGEHAAATNQISEAIVYLNQAASAFESRAHQDPAQAAISRQAAKSCRERIDVLRSTQ